MLSRLKLHVWRGSEQRILLHAFRGIILGDCTWCGFVWRNITQSGVTWRCVTWKDVTWRGIPLTSIRQRGIIWKDVTWRGIPLTSVWQRDVTWWGPFHCSGFYTPEEFFLEEKAAKFDWGSTNPANYLTDCAKAATKQEYHKKVSFISDFSYFTLWMVCITCTVLFLISTTIGRLLGAWLNLSLVRMSHDIGGEGSSTCL